MWASQLFVSVQPVFSGAGASHAPSTLPGPGILKGRHRTGERNARIFWDGNLRSSLGLGLCV